MRVVHVARKVGGSAYGGRAADLSQDFDLGEGVLLCLLRLVRQNHELDGNEWKQRIAEQDQRELNHNMDSFVM